MKNSKPYIVRGFDVDNAGRFTSMGQMENLPGFEEITVDKQHEAVEAILTGKSIGSMSAENIKDVVTNVNNLGTGSSVVVIDLKVVTSADSANDLRSYRSGVREVFKSWAEKSRIPGIRGWRSNAIKTPTIEFDPSLNDVVIKTQVVLSTAVLYNENHATIVPADFQQTVKDLSNLKYHLEQTLGSYYETLYYNHSKFGKGEVL